jgi:hypothetical protein
MSPEYMQALMAGAAAPVPTRPTQAQPKKKKRNFLLDQLSTAGSIGGGIAGSFITPILGTGAGAAAGGMLGETIENLIDPEGGNWGNVAKEGALSAVMGAGPVKLLKGAGAGAKALATGADDVVGTASKAALTPLRQKAGQAIIGEADNLAVKNFRLTPTQLTNFQKKFGEDAGQVIRKYGFQNADDITSKGIEPLQAQFDEAITGITGVTKDSLQKNLMKRINKLSTAGPSDTKAIGGQLKKEADNLLKNYGDVIDANELNTIRRQFDDLVNYTEKAANPSRYGVNKRMADGIRETLQQADTTGNLKNVGRELQKLRQLSDVASRQGNLGRGSLPFSIGNLPGTVMGAGAGGPGGAAVGYAANAVANSNTGRRLTMNAAEKVGGKLAGVKGGQSPLGIAARLGATGLAKGGQEQPQSLEDAMSQSLENSATTDMTMNTNMNTPNSSNMMDSQYSQGEDLSSPFNPANVEANIQNILTQGGDMSDVKEYLGIVETLQSFKPQASDQKPLNQGQQERADLIKALDNTDSIMAGGSINYGPVGSRVEGIKGVFNAADPETLAFKNTVSGLRAAITKARAGASLTPGELKMLAQYTPTDTDSEQVVRSKLQQLRALYGYQAPTGGGSSLEDALMQYQQR